MGHGKVKTEPNDSEISSRYKTKKHEILFEVEPCIVPLFSKRNRQTLRETTPEHMNQDQCEDKQFQAQMTIN